MFQIGINDFLEIGTKSGDEVVRNMEAAFEQMFREAVAKGIKVYGGTVSPGTLSEEVDAYRQTLNTWIRQQYAQGHIDELVDFDQLLREPDNPLVIVPTLREDTVHPNLTGYKAMGDYVYSLLLEDLA